MQKPFKPKIFVSYSHNEKDKSLKKIFDTNLAVMKEQDLIESWTDAEILPGDRWPEEIAEAMSESHLIIFMVSNHFLASSFIRRKEAPIAMTRVNQGKSVIVPIILTKTPGWQTEDWNVLQALPSEVKPIDHLDWGHPENAFADVEEKLRELIVRLPEKLSIQKKQWEMSTQTGIPSQREGEQHAQGSSPNKNINTQHKTKENELKQRTKNNSKLKKSRILATILLILIGVPFLLLLKNQIQKNSAEAIPAFDPEDSYSSKRPYVNSLGMRFISIPNQNFLASIWETRVSDYATYSASEKPPIKYITSLEPKNTNSGRIWSKEHNRTWKEPGFEQNKTHPVVGISLIAVSYTHLTLPTTPYV